VGDKTMKMSETTMMSRMVMMSRMAMMRRMMMRETMGERSQGYREPEPKTMPSYTLIGSWPNQPLQIGNQ